MENDFGVSPHHHLSIMLRLQKGFIKSSQDFLQNLLFGPEPEKEILKKCELSSHTTKIKDDNMGMLAVHVEMDRKLISVTPKKFTVIDALALFAGLERALSIVFAIASAVLIR